MNDETLMRRRSATIRLRLAAAFGLLLVFCASALLALDIPPPPSQWYTDSAGLLTADQASALNEKLRNFETQSGTQFIIYVFPSLQGEALEDFTIRCADKWKVGNKKYDNGLILFVFVQEKKLRIEVGYGLEGTVTDAYSSRVIRDFIAPHFKQGDWAGGLNAGADALIAKIRGGEAPVPPTSPGAQPQGSSGPARYSGSSGLPCSPFLILVAIVFGLIILPRILMPHGRHGCGGCIFPFFVWPGGGSTFGGGGFSGGGGGFGGGFGGGGFSGGGGGFGGGGASGGW